MRDVYNALCEKGYNPLAQIVGYLLSEDPTYITSYNGARTKIVKIDRYELMENILKDYIETPKVLTKTQCFHDILKNQM